jgi:hypothetical protein
MWLAGVAWIGGCATPQMSVAELTSRAQANVLAAQRDLAGKTIVVYGRVRASTLVATEKMEAERWGHRVEAQMVSESIPMVLLEPGSVQCYFEPQRIGDAADLQRGQDVALRCVVYSFESNGPYAITVLGECRRAE